MNATQAEFFLLHGYVRLTAFHAKARLNTIRQGLHDETQRRIEAAGFARSLRRLPVFQQIGKLSAAVRTPGAHHTLVTSALIAEVTQLAGRSPSDIQQTQWLLSPAHQGAWTLEGLNWHIDIAAERQDRIPGIQAFFLIDDVAPQGGATLALAGSHRAAAQGVDSRSAVRDALKAGGSREQRLQELGMHIVEMCGRAGDVFLMDMRVLHTPSVNSSRCVRMMATCRCFFDAPGQRVVREST